MRYVQGQDRGQSIMLPPMIDEYVTDENPVRVIDAFIDSQDMQKLGFTHAAPKAKGRKPYNPKDILKLYVYGYLNKVSSSRLLEKETHKNIEVMWLVRMLQPDFKTIADFRKNNRKAIKKILKEFHLFCKKLDLFDLELFAVDGSKFAAVNHNRKAYKDNQIKKILKNIDERIQEYFSKLDQSDEAEKDVKKPTADKIKKLIQKLKTQKQIFESYQEQLAESGESQIVSTDPDSRIMKTANKGHDVCYNAQIAVDKKHKLIAACDVTSDANDKHQIYNIAIQLQETFDIDSFKAVADVGYNQKDELKECYDIGVHCFAPKPKNSAHNKSKMHTNEDFRYDSEIDVYICPEGHEMTPRAIYEKHGRNEICYKTSGCKSCSQRIKCTTSKEGRRIYRWEHQDILDILETELEQNPQYMKYRREMVEHPFGTLKRACGMTYFLCKGLEMVNTEFNLAVLAYNFRRVIKIIGVKELIAAMA